MSRIGTSPPTTCCILGVPAGSISLSRFWAHLYHWIQGLELAFSFSEGNRIEINRSFLIASARAFLNGEECKRRGERPPLVMVDTDVLPTVPLLDALHLVGEDFTTGYDIVCSPTQKFDEQLGRLRTLFRPLGGDTSNVKPDGPFEVEAAAFGLVFLSARLLESLQPLTAWEWKNGRRVELFCDFSRTSEDYDLCLRARDLGFRVCVDPRLTANHLKAVPIPSWRGNTPMTGDSAEDRSVSSTPSPGPGPVGDKQDGDD